jgi:hypothetical protein
MCLTRLSDEGGIEESLATLFGGGKRFLKLTVETAALIGIYVWKSF